MDSLTRAIIRVLKSDGSTVGTGFVVSADGLIATCAHVVEAAESGPGQKVRVAFDAAGENCPATDVCDQVLVTIELLPG